MGVTMQKVWAVLLVAMLMLEPASSLPIEMKTMSDSGSSKDSGSGSSGKDDGDDNATKDEARKLLCPSLEETPMILSRMGLQLEVLSSSVCWSVSRPANRAARMTRRLAAKVKTGKRKTSSNSNPSSSSPGNHKKSLEEDDDEPLPVVHKMHAKKKKA